ncbi:acetyltransferase (GNAT) family, putative [Phytophthora infestans T30-4]|uniref:Acetyltransferase (GNAT) family, putative n=1 Tax=Phytophthora infestans (strain T30-4) TaxID=403677 RepID=D0NLC3_PHYIT|nr:acetyltransferase (GNAT) family, putative [Phytophthora infestans T30-4]EEY60441.1 acetyltransferase (GNAT) family, putative [Phytophthora infestans T30-4]|eukprot:XP_002900237.1 acetyltransferase (GNAT) family, putative [Phytophthora infestans T30-4]
MPHTTSSTRSELAMTTNVVFEPVDKSNVQRLRELNLQLFPVRYNLAFYKEVVSSPPGYAQLACVGSYAVGAICCRREPVKEGPEGLERTYIMTLGVLESYRRARIGSQLLEKVVAQSAQDGVVQVYLHVQTSNSAALRFYRSHGFEATQILRDYYKHIEPPDCYVLRRQLTP